MNRGGSLEVSVGIASETGRRRQNEDFAAARTTPSPHGCVIALADGMGGTKGGRVAAELAVRSFVTDFYATPPTLGVLRAANRVMEAANTWIHAQGRVDPALDGMGTTFTGLVLRGRSAHIVHVGDSRAWRFRDGVLTQLTDDHTMRQPGLEHALLRAIGLEATLRLDYRREPVERHDRFLLTSDGVHGSLSVKALQALLGNPVSAEASARAIVDEALARGSSDNVTAVVVDVVALPAPDRDSLVSLLADLPIKSIPKPGQTLDGFVIGDVISSGRYSRLLRAKDSLDGTEVVLKFPRPQLASDHVFRAAFVREAWIAAEVSSPHIGRVITPALGRQSQLYSVLVFHAGETLETRLSKRGPLSLSEVLRIMSPLLKAVAALHRQGIIHRDIKPENIMLDPVTLIDLGVALVKGQDDDLGDERPGTPSYLAPELFGSARADEATDIFAIGVTLYRVLTGHYPYGEIEPFSRHDFRNATPLSVYRQDLPDWIGVVIQKAIAIRPQDRYHDVIELMFAIENGPTTRFPPVGRRLPLIERNPVRFWQCVSLVLLLLLGMFSLGTGTHGPLDGHPSTTRLP